MDPQKIIELANLLRNNGDKILNSEFTLTLSGSLLRALNDSFTLITDKLDFGVAATSRPAFHVVKPNNAKSPVFRDLQLVYDFVQKTTLLCIVQYPGDEPGDGTIDISKFAALQRLEVRKTNVRQIVGVQPLRTQLQELICVRSLQAVEDIITHCGGDKSNGFVWNALKFADFSYNQLQTCDSSLEFAQYLQHLNLSHNALHSVAAIKWLPHLKTLDLSYNRLTCIPPLHMEAYKRLQRLNISNNFVEDLGGITKLDAITEMELADNCLLDHTYLLPLSTLDTLKYLSLYGNPLHCHPRHRLATAQYLHRNTATVHFILDLEPLSKSERALTGSQQLRHVGALNRYATKSSASMSIGAASSSGRPTPTTHTPASSVGSLRSFRLDETAAEAETNGAEQTSRKRGPKMRTVVVEEAVGGGSSLTAIDAVEAASTVEAAKQSDVLAAIVSDHEEVQRQIETLRSKYGANWLQAANAGHMHNVLGIESTHMPLHMDAVLPEATPLDSSNIDTPNTVVPPTQECTAHSSTPTYNESAPLSLHMAHISPIKLGPAQGNAVHNINVSTNTTEGTLYMSMDKSMNSSDDGYKSVNDFDSGLQVSKATDEEPVDDLQHIYSSAGTEEEEELSEPECDEQSYFVYRTNCNEVITLTISGNHLREKDACTQRTKTKWSLKILESCDRIKSNQLRINFDTVKVDKQERIYTVEDGLCQELEAKLRTILSKRDLAEMNQTIYRCVNCTCQFSRENNYKTQHKALNCPDCGSKFVAEIHDAPMALEKAGSKRTTGPADIAAVAEEKLSPAAIVEETSTSSPPLASTPTGPATVSMATDETNSIGSANSLNESSSCSKLSNSSFDSNQSMVGSSNTDRDNDFRTNCESDVDIISNPSQSSIEVLDHAYAHSSRKTSEERRISQTPNLATIDDQSGSFTPSASSFIEREFSSQRRKAAAESTPTNPRSGHEEAPPAALGGHLGQFNLTESSSSGSVTDSVCTAYEQQAAKEESKKSSSQLLIAEEQLQVKNNNNSSHKENGALRREDSGISSMFGALFQSTNMLMSSSKKLLNAEVLSSPTIQTGQRESPAPQAQRTSSCRPYKFNYRDFSDIDHRLKLYFYQSKFREDGEHFKWLARGRIYNELTRTVADGIVVVSTCSFYLLEAYAPPHDDVTKWLRHVINVTVDRLEAIQLLPWKIGLAFRLRGWGGFLLLLQDILRTDSLLLFFANNSLPDQCELFYQPAETISKRLLAAIGEEKLKMCALLNACEIRCDNARRSLAVCALLTTDTRLSLSASGKVDWLCAPHGDSDHTVSSTPRNEDDVEVALCLTQLMSNLVDVERPLPIECIMNFHDETQDKREVWRCTFETKENADSCLQAVAQSWELIFGVPLFGA